MRFRFLFGRASSSEASPEEESDDFFFFRFRPFPFLPLATFFLVPMSESSSLLFFFLSESSSSLKSSPDESTSFAFLFRPRPFCLVILTSIISSESESFITLFLAFSLRFLALASSSSESVSPSLTFMNFGSWLFDLEDGFFAFEEDFSEDASLLLAFLAFLALAPFSSLSLRSLSLLANTASLANFDFGIGFRLDLVEGLTSSFSSPLLKDSRSDSAFFPM